MAKNYTPLKHLIKKYMVSRSKVYKAVAKKEFSFRRSGKIRGRIYVVENDFLNWLAPYEVEAENQEAI